MLFLWSVRRICVWAFSDSHLMEMRMPDSVEELLRNTVHFGNPRYYTCTKLGNELPKELSMRQDISAISINRLRVTE